jgi:D-glycero-alpha-D-manno-heptose-7-phosphate kinase
MDLDRGVEIQHNADLPAMSGIGSSSAFTVGLLNALYALKGQITSKRQLALDAIHVEQERIKENVGSQDQTSATFGGLNKIEFGGLQRIQVYPLTISQEKLNYLENHLMLFFTGFPRNASQIAGEQIRKTPQKQRELRAMREMVDEAVKILNDGKDNLKDFGKLLNETWKIKRGLTPQITNSFIDEVYEAAMRTGALGGKVLGAGGGGFILLFVEPELQGNMKEKFRDLLHVPFKFENLGSQIIYFFQDNNF